MAIALSERIARLELVNAQRNTKGILVVIRELDGSLRSFEGEPLNESDLVGYDKVLYVLMVDKPDYV